MAEAETGREVARGKTGIVFFDYRTRTKAPVPAGFRARFD
jgi:4-hydroxybenzoyl-CoA thioesterase